MLIVVFFSKFHIKIINCVGINAENSPKLEGSQRAQTFIDASPPHLNKVASPYPNCIF